MATTNSPLFSPLYQWSILILLGMVYFLATATTFTSLGVVLPGMIGELKWSWTEAGFGFTLLGLTCGLASFLPSLLIRKIGVRLTLLLGTLIFVAGFYSLYSTVTISQYFLGTALIGIGFTLLATVPGTYVLSRLFEKQSLAFGLYFTIGGLGGVAGPWIYFYASNQMGSWRMHWVLCAIYLSVVTLITILALREGKREQQHAKHIMQKQISDASKPIYRTKEVWTVRRALRTWQFYLIAATYTSFLWCGITVNSFAVAHIEERGFGMTVAVSLLSTMAFVNAFSRFIGGAAGEWLEPKKLLIGSLIIMVFGVICLSIATSWIWLILFVLCVGIGYGMTFLASSVLLSNYFGRGPYLELFSVVNLISTVACLAPFIAGAVKDYTDSFTPAFLIIAAPVIVILMFTLMMKPPVLSVKK
ncbi:MFS transporter [Providencia stuartii]|uniref:MFS transporter n=1 Tax=Providencia stuartii TaxID=588 RepID=A0A1S1HWP4_PROST|nr:MFS transporter [Providencia sp. 2023EL-00965]ELR5299631.1 MFS transporter [Providencia stuartii]MDW7588598.1 MFS transporter [Providencia sp. 2023EL-00965]OHT25723.1 MFS transporter [Providencia stuartii]HEF8773417.1 MFS transporter [Providencia stuartii]